MKNEIRQTSLIKTGLSYFVTGYILTLCEQAYKAQRKPIAEEEYEGWAETE